MSKVVYYFSIIFALLTINLASSNLKKETMESSMNQAPLQLPPSNCMGLTQGQFEFNPVWRLPIVGYGGVKFTAKGTGFNVGVFDAVDGTIAYNVLISKNNQGTTILKDQTNCLLCTHSYTLEDTSVKHSYKIAFNTNNNSIKFSVDGVSLNCVDVQGQLFSRASFIAFSGEVGMGIEICDIYNVGPDM
jgi:hypothetical protein